MVIKLWRSIEKLNPASCFKIIYSIRGAKIRKSALSLLRIRGWQVDNINDLAAGYNFGGSDLQCRFRHYFKVILLYIYIFFFRKKSALILKRCSQYTVPARGKSSVINEIFQKRKVQGYNVYWILSLFTPEKRAIC